jgi:hypothetical protein
MGVRLQNLGSCTLVAQRADLSKQRCLKPLYQRAGDYFRVARIERAAENRARAHFFSESAPPIKR